MSDFTELTFPGVIDTSSTDFMTDFYTPLLSRAEEYKRGAGFFSKSWIQSAARGLSRLAENGGTAKWLTSPILDEATLEALQKGNNAKWDDELRASLQDSIDKLEQKLAEDIKNAIAWMIADGILEIRLAVPESGLSGEFHDKWGICTDEAGNRVAFHGSQNDSRHAQRNYEAYDVFCDWRNQVDAERADKHEARFDQLWNGDVESVGIYSIPEGIRRDLIELRTTDDRPYDAPTEIKDDENEITLRDYQQEAVDAWFANGRQGLFEMATGTGKTYTALGALDQLRKATDEPLFVVVSVSMRHLAPQWAESLADFGFTAPTYIYGSRNQDWAADLERLVSDFEHGFSDSEIVITTHTTGAKKHFRDQISNLDKPALLIADEVHNLGSEYRRKGLLPEYDYRLGLSATPERYYDQEGSEFLLRYFSSTVYQFTLSDAIPDYLTEYKYYP
jgi:hypothetical protein